MRAVIQRVIKSEVLIKGEIFNQIGKGLVILLGIEDTDNEQDIKWLVSKILKMRIFEDEHSFMNLSVSDIQGEVLVISQFTLFASIKKGNRPSYIRASKPEKAVPLYENFIKQMQIEFKKEVKTGVFGADMKVNFVNDGPVTILIDTKNKE